MLLVPYVVGVAMSRPAWLHVPLLVAWLGGYLGSYYGMLALKTRRVRRVRRQLLVYSAVTAPSAILVLVARPDLFAFAPAFAGLLAVNAWFAWHRRDRAVVNDLASVVQSALMVPVAAMVVGVPPGSVADAFTVVLLYFAGTVLFVKTMIRERGDAAHLRASVAFHALAAVVAALIAWPFGVLFGWLLARAVVLPRYPLSPKQIGVAEIAHSVALLALVPLLS